MLNFSYTHAYYPTLDEKKIINWSNTNMITKKTKINKCHVHLCPVKANMSVYELC